MKQELAIENLNLTNTSNANIEISTYKKEARARKSGEDSERTSWQW